MKNFEDYTITVGMFEGYPIEHTVTAESQQEMSAAGFSASEIYDFHNTYRDWQADC